MSLVDDLLQLAPSEYHAYVRKALDDDDAWLVLLHPRLVTLTLQTLHTLTQDVDVQLGQRKAALEAARVRYGARVDGKGPYLELRAQYYNWRTRTLGFKRVLVRRQGEAQAAVRHSQPDRPAVPQAMKMQHNLGALFTLARSVLEHRDATIAHGEARERDVHLWRTLEALTTFSVTKGTQTLLEWVQDAMDQPSWVPPLDET